MQGLLGGSGVRGAVQRGSFTAAAVELGYTQSAVSRQVAALERAAGRTLFDRRTGGVVLTAAGLTLVRHAVVALDAVAAAERELSGLRPDRGVVRLGTFPSASALILTLVDTVLLLAVPAGSALGPAGPWTCRRSPTRTGSRAR